MALGLGPDQLIDPEVRMIKEGDIRHQRLGRNGGGRA